MTKKVRDLCPVHGCRRAKMTGFDLCIKHDLERVQSAHKSVETIYDNCEWVHRRAAEQDLVHLLTVMSQQGWIPQVMVRPDGLYSVVAWRMKP